MVKTVSSRLARLVETRHLAEVVVVDTVADTVAAEAEIIMFQVLMRPQRVQLPAPVRNEPLRGVAE
jgi:hypothetical protein